MHLSRFLAAALTAPDPIEAAHLGPLVRALATLGDAESRDAVVRRCMHWALETDPETDPDAAATTVTDRIARARLLAGLLDDGRRADGALPALAGSRLCDAAHAPHLIRLAYTLAHASTWSAPAERTEARRDLEQLLETDTLAVAGHDRATHRTNFDAVEDALTHLAD